MTLAALAASAGIKLVEKILSRKLGDDGGELAATVLRDIAARAGVEVGQLDAMVDDNPGPLITAMREVEKAAPEMVALYSAEVQLQMARLQAEQDEPVWMRAWRPAGMYLIGFLWLWNVVILHVCNAIWRIALPPVPFADLVQLSALYMGLYMGGHTIKDVAARWLSPTADGGK